MTYEILDVNSNNIDQIGLFCKQSQKKEEGYQNKVHWIKERFPEGLRYKLLKVKERNKYSYRGMIEYIPGEFNWRGIKADNFMVIHCLWVVGRHKGNGYASKLIQFAIDDARALEMNGVVGMTAEKGGWLPRKAIYEKHGFTQVDSYGANFRLYTKFFTSSSDHPSFHPISDDFIRSFGEGVSVLYSHQCPYMSPLLDDVEQFADNNNLFFRSKVIKSAFKAQNNALHPYGTFCIVCNGSILPYKPGIKKEVLKRMRSEV